MLPKDIENVVEESSRKLFQISKPPVRYYLLTDVMGRGLDEQLVQETLKECREYPLRKRLLETLRSDGTWPISKVRKAEEDAGPGPPIGWTYITMLRNLFELGEYRTSSDEGYVSESLEKILSWQTKEGYIVGPTTDLFPLPHYNGYALRTLTNFGMEDDPRVQRLIRWIFKTQRPDGGWTIPYLEDVKYLPQFKHMRMPAFMDKIRSGEVQRPNPDSFEDIPSCIWTTLMVVRGMCQSYSLPERPEVRRGFDLVLNNFFKRNYHSTFLRSERNWTKLKYPTYSGSGLCALDLLTWVGYGADDPRMEKPIKWLLSARSNDGFWSQSDRPHPYKDQWITEISLSVLSRYAQSIRGVPFGMRAELLRSRRA